ncbi:MAG TPA: tryptophan--tRNA ligase, partial [candidate division Zixibacteria bacterium]|nr:tryptophan--tRNA ligase [candidate division Zixibacteria bacterium]
MARKVVLSGMQPTGRLHLGNYEGALKNWVHLQEEYEAYYMIVDWHALTSDYDQTAELPEQIRQMAIDFLAAGVNPEKASVYVQSQVKEHAELFLLFSMIIPTPWLERVPSYKEKSEEMNLDSYGFLGYPLLQAADILIYRADFVPVGKDQLPHIELTREVCRRFNSLYGVVFPEPQELLTKFPV